MFKLCSRRRFSTSPSSRPYDVLVNGGGVVGAAFAVSLLREVGPGSKLRIGIVEPRKPPTLASCTAREGPDVRVYAMSPRSIETLAAIDSWKHVAARSQAYDSMQVWESNGPGLLRFSASETGQSELGRIVEDCTLQAAIYQTLEEGGHVNSGNVDLLFGQTISKLEIGRDANTGSPHLAEVTLSPSSGSSSAASAPLTTKVQARLVVGADGAASVVRKLSGGGAWGWSYGQEALVATVRVSAQHSTAWQRYLTGSGPLALLPLWGGLSSIVWSLPVMEARRLSALPTDEFIAALNEALQAPPKTDRWSVLEPSDAPFSRPVRELAALADAVLSAATLMTPPSASAAAFQAPPVVTGLVSARVAFPLQLQQASHYTSARVALVGDAAHSIHPQAGQGLNLGIADARVLASAVAGALAVGGDIGDASFLRREYGLPQYTANLAMIGAVDGINSIFGLSGGGAATRAVQMLRGAGMLAINALGPVKAKLAKRAMGH